MPNASLSNLSPLPVPHRKQEQPADCLAACAAMVLAYLKQSVPYAYLLTLLDIKSFGAPRRNILNLSRLGLKVTYREATLPIVVQYLQQGNPVIVFVDTGELTSYWSITTNHALVVIGLDTEYVLVNDPAYSDAPKRITHGEFELAWLNSDNICAIVQTVEE